MIIDSSIPWDNHRIVLNGIFHYAGYLDRVRRDLAFEFAEGPYRVRTTNHPDGANFWEFLQHVRAVVRGFVRHAPEIVGLSIRRDNAVWRSESMNFVCVDLDDEVFSADTPSATQTIYFARENRNHLDSKTPPQMLRSWTGRAAPVGCAAGYVGQPFSGSGATGSGFEQKTGKPAFAFDEQLSGAEDELEHTWSDDELFRACASFSEKTKTAVRKDRNVFVKLAT